MKVLQPEVDVSYLPRRVDTNQRASVTRAVLKITARRKNYPSAEYQEHQEENKPVDQNDWTFLHGVKKKRKKKEVFLKKLQLK